MTVILLDGAMGTELERRGARMDAPLWSAHALLDDPVLVREIHLDYLRAGAQVITTNTFRTHARNLAAGGQHARARELTRMAVWLAQEARDAHAAADPQAGAAVRIAGSLSPLEDCFRPADSPGSDAGPEHRRMAEDLTESGCDVLLVETMGRVDEALAAVTACQGLGPPVWLSVVCRADGHLLAGEPLADLVRALAPLELQALMINCTELRHLEAAIPALVEAAAQRPELTLGTYPHTGHQDPVRGWQTHAVAVDEFAALLSAWTRRAPLGVVGSCCGSTPAWTAALAQRLHAEPQARDAARAALMGMVPRRA